MKEFKFNSTDKGLLARLRGMPIFDSMEANQLQYLLKFARFRKYDESEAIIQEGETDQLVYFLLQGGCDVMVDNMDVGQITTVGDVFGEMGMIDQTPRSATITASMPTACLVLDGSFLEKMENVDKVASQALFYRIFSEILAARIRDANAKILKLESELEDLSVKGPSL